VLVRDIVKNVLSFLFGVKFLNVLMFYLLKITVNWRSYVLKS